MAEYRTLQPNWQQWLQSNLQRGCSVPSMVDAMTRAGFTVANASTLIAQARELQMGYAAAAPTAKASGPRFNHAGPCIDAGDRRVDIVMRNAKPMVAVVGNLFSDEECEEIIRLSRAKLRRSSIVDPDTGGTRVIEARSSEGAFFSRTENDFIAKLEARISRVMNWPVENGEGLQVLHYEPGGEYKPHYDYFRPENLGSHVHLAKGGQRVSTMVMYLNDVDEGGETLFPEVGLSVTPRRGSAVYFEYCDAQGQIDPLTLHAAAPVRKGEKWIATKWMRQGRYVP